MNYASIANPSKPLSKFLYLPDGWNDAWVAAKAAAANTPAWITGIGDSIMAGQNASDYQTKSYFSLVRANLLKSYSLYGDFFSLENTSNYGPPTSVYPIVINSVSTLIYATYGRVLDYGANPPMPSITFTTPYACTQVDLYYLNYVNNGTFGYNVDGGSTVVITQTGGNSTAAGSKIQKTSITGLSNAVHTIQIGGAGGSQVGNALIFIGFACYSNPSAGIGFANAAVNGQGMATSPQANNFLTDSAKFPPDKIGIWQGYQGTTASPSPVTGFGFPTAPSLALLGEGVNDTTQGSTETNFKNGYQRLITALRRGVKNCSILFVIPWLADSNSSSTLVAANDYTGTQQPAYRSTIQWIYDLAYSYNCAIVNIHAKWGETPFADGNIHSATDIHPTDAGYADIANVLNTII